MLLSFAGALLATRAASVERHPNNSWNQLVVAKEKVVANQNNTFEEWRGRGNMPRRLPMRR